MPHPGSSRPGVATLRRRTSSAAAKWFLLALMLPAVCWASPTRVGILGGESSLLFDTTNLLKYPSLARTVAHADVELFNDWAGAVVPVGQSSAIGLFLNRPTTQLRSLNSYIASTGGRLFRSLTPTPLMDAVVSTRLRPGIQVGATLRLAHDRRRRGAAEAAAGLRQALIGISIAPGKPRGLDGTLRIDDITFTDRDAGSSAAQTDGRGFGFEARGRWRLGSELMALPWISWERTDAGLSPQTRRLTFTRAGLGINTRPRPGILIVAGLMTSLHEERIDEVATGVDRTRILVLPATIGGAEIRSGAFVVRVGIQHRVHWAETGIGDLQEETLTTDLSSQLGLGVEMGGIVIDGLLRKRFLLDGPYLLTGGDEVEGGLFTNLSLTYRLFD